MSDLYRDVGSAVSAIAGEWAKYSVVGSFLFYACGYLALRFHLTALGIGTDLSVFDDRYVFAGARFFVYVASVVPGIMLLAALVLLPCAMAVWIVSRRWPVPKWPLNLAARRPLVVTVFGVIQAVAAIQFVMRRCFVLTNVLLAPALPEDPSWLKRLLLADDLYMGLFFAGLLLMCAVSWGVLSMVPRDTPGVAAPARAVLSVLLVVQIMLLPINYGVLIMDKWFPRVTSVGGVPLADLESTWLAWEGRDGVTYLVQRNTNERVLLTLPRGDVTRTEIVRFDPIIPTLFGKEEPHAGFSHR